MAFKICVIGLWHLGCVLSCSMARKHVVAAFDPDGRTVDALRRGEPPILEPGLPEAIAEGMASGRLRFEQSLQKAVSGAQVIWFAFDLPVNENDEPQTRVLESAFSDALSAGARPQAFVVSSQVPIGTCRKLFEKGKKAVGAELFYVPENLRLGNAVKGFFSQDRIVIGTPDGSKPSIIEDILEGVGGERILLSLESAEMAKHAMNSYLALMISFSGEISDICEAYGADAMKVMDALKKESRVSPLAPLSPGLGFGGGTLARDLQALRSAARKKGMKTFVLDAALESNNERKGYVKRRLQSALGSLEGKTVSFLGLTYKPNTDTLRRSLALEIIDGLAATGAVVRAYDPAVKKLDAEHHVSVCASADEAFSGADAVVITTAWPEFLGLDFARLVPAMRTRVLIDARNMLSGKKFPAQTKYYGVGVNRGED
jgi:UDPglucose 6-dehydrogenase